MSELGRADQVAPSAIEVALAGLQLGYLSVTAGDPVAVGDPVGDGWFGVDQIIEDGSLISEWLDLLRLGEARQRSDVAGAYLASWLADAVVGPVAAAVLDHGRGWPVTAGQLAVHRHDEGWFDGVAVRGQTVWVLPDDPLCGRPQAHVVADREALFGRVADGVVAVLDPVFAAVRARTRLGLPVMWGAVGDGIASAAVDRARDAGTDAHAVWHTAQALVDTIAARRPRAQPGTALTPVAWSGGSACFAVRGTCCLYYKVSGEPLDRDGEAYCTRCPLRDPADRDRRWSAWLETQAHG